MGRQDTNLEYVFGGTQFYVLNTQCKYQQINQIVKTELSIWEGIFSGIPFWKFTFCTFG